jgi:hypothetical protein
MWYRLKKEALSPTFAGVSVVGFASIVPFAENPGINILYP